MKITVFGGSGFLGSHIADALTQNGHQVCIFDRIKSPYLQEGQEMIVGDILDEKLVKDTVKGSDVVYNFIALADIDEAMIAPVLTAKVNIIGNVNILEACKEANVKRFIFASSIYVYSDSGSFYRCSKQSAELFIENYHRAYNLDYTVLRYGSLYGPRSDERNWVYRTLKQALLDKQIIREGDGQELREYIHVEDAAQLSVDILKEEFRNRCVIITGAEQIKIRDLLTMIKEMMKGEIEVQYIKASSSEHYKITPYVFKPQMAKKLRVKESIDMGQGLLNIMGDIHDKHVVSLDDTYIHNIVDT